MLLLTFDDVNQGSKIDQFKINTNFPTYDYVDLSLWAVEVCGSGTTSLLSSCEGQSQGNENLVCQAVSQSGPRGLSFGQSLIRRAHGAGSTPKRYQVKFLSYS